MSLLWLMWHRDFYSRTQHCLPACLPSLSVLESVGQILETIVGAVILGRVHTALS